MNLSFLKKHPKNSEACADSLPDSSSARESEFRIPPNLKNISRSFAKAIFWGKDFAKTSLDETNPENS